MKNIYAIKIINNIIYKTFYRDFSIFIFIYSVQILVKAQSNNRHLYREAIKCS